VARTVMPGTGAEQRVDELRGGVDEVLAVVEHDERRARRRACRRAPAAASCRRGSGHAQRRGDELGDESASPSGARSTHADAVERGAAAGTRAPRPGASCRSRRRR
jgi:hypothetical protein